MAEWFAPKRYGIGAGKSISWQGWAVMIAYIVLIVIAGFVLPKSPLVSFAILISATVALLIISGRTTRGGWRWRWDKSE